MQINMASCSRVLYTFCSGKVLCFLCILLRFQQTLQMEEDPLDMLLTSYKTSRENFSVKRKFDFHRHVRDCQPIIYGKTTYETFPVVKNTNSKKSPNMFKSFFKKVETKDGHSYVYGHIVTVSNPFESISVLEPQKPGGCKTNLRSTVATTSQQLNCKFAVNAGFFNTHSGSCLGNIVSSGKLVRDAKGIQNANFGILKNGTLLVGYLSEYDVTPGNGTSEFYQLVTGVIWILRNGDLYINQSIEAECRDTEETGTLKKFANVLSARTAVGHDKNGQVVIVQVDGKTNVRGMNLYDFGKLLQSYGLVNAINLDGGGSATFVQDGTVVNYPSDQCHGYLCARKVSTVLCVHGKVCDPPDCNGHGDCGNDGKCVCHTPWNGPSCSIHQELYNGTQYADMKNLYNISGNFSTSQGNETTSEVIKRFLIKNYALMDAILVISVLINFIFLFVTFCGRSSDRIVVTRRQNKSGSCREDQMNLLNSNNDDDEI